MIVDTSALLAYFDTNEPDHEAVSRVLERSSELLVVSPYVVAELEYLVATRVGVDAELAVLRELSSSAWELDGFSRRRMWSALPRSSQSSATNRLA